MSLKENKTLAKKIPLKKEIDNSPYLPVIDYRIGNFTTFKHNMIESIKKGDLIKKGWTDNGDFNYGIVLIKMWAYLLDILSYYNERIINESYIRTAQLRESVIKQCKFIDYKLRPGVAATSYVAFTAEKDKQGIVPKGFKLQTKSISGKAPQIFETDEKILISDKLNEMSLYVPENTYNLEKGVWLNKNHDNAKKGDFVLIVKNDFNPDDLVVKEKTVVTLSGEQSSDPHNQNISYKWQQMSGEPVSFPSDSNVDITFTTPAVAVGETKDLHFALTVVNPQGLTSITSFTLHVIHDDPLRGYGNDWVITKITNVNLEEHSVEWAPISPNFNFNSNDSSVYLVAGKMNVFGYNSPDSSVTSTLGIDPPGKLPDGIFKNNTYTAGTLNKKYLRLDKIYDAFDENDYVIIINTKELQNGFSGNNTKLYKIRNVTESSAAQYGLNSKVTILVVGRDLPNDFLIRDTLVLGNLVKLGTTSKKKSINQKTKKTEKSLNLSGFLTGLKEGMYVSISDSKMAPKITRIIGVSPSEDSTTIYLKDELSGEFDMLSTKINANVTTVSQGETIKDEILGSGNAGMFYQEFSLRESPVTFTQSALGKQGIENSLEVFVNDVKWREVEGFLESSGIDKHFVTLIDEVDRMSVKSGDGIHGSFLPTGTDNVRVTYRKGLGQDGNCDPNTITTMMGASPFAKSVTNPYKASGGEDREDEKNAKISAPRSIKSLDRAVSLEDYLNLTLNYSGIAKAATFFVKSYEGHSNKTEQIKIIIAPKGGGDASDLTKKNLRTYLDLRRDTNIPLVIENYEQVPIDIEVKIKVKDDYLQISVKKSVETALGTTRNEDGSYNFFAFDQLQFGETIYLSKIYSAISKVDGVEYVVVTKFGKDPTRDFVLIKENQIATLGNLKITAEGGRIE